MLSGGEQRDPVASQGSELQVSKIGNRISHGIVPCDLLAVPSTSRFNYRSSLVELALFVIRHKFLAPRISALLIQYMLCKGQHRGSGGLAFIGFISLAMIPSRREILSATIGDLIPI